MYRRQKNNFKVLLQRKHVKDSLQKGNEMLQFSASKPLTIRTWHLQVCWILVCHNFQLYISAAVPTFSEPHQHLKHQSHQIVDQLSPFLHQQLQCLNWSAGLLPYPQECVLQDKWNASVAPAVCTTIVTVSSHSKHRYSKDTPSCKAADTQLPNADACFNEPELQDVHGMERQPT